MEQLVFESGTESIPTNIMGYAIASTCLEVKFTISDQVTSSVAPEVIELNVANANQRTESLLFESVTAGWPWVIADINPRGTVLDSWSYSSPVLGYASNMNRAALFQGDILLHAAVLPESSRESPFGLLLTPFNKEGHVFGLVGNSPVHRISNIRRLGMALATEWIDAWASNETTRGIRVYGTTIFNAVCGEQARSQLDRYMEVGELQRHPWLSDAEQDLRKLSNLSDNWNGYGAEAPNTAAQHNAQTVLDSLHDINLQPSRIIPSAAGGISLCFFRPMKYAEIECYNSGESIAIIKNTQTNWRDIWEVDSVTDSLGKIRAFLEE